MAGFSAVSTDTPGRIACVAGGSGVARLLSRRERLVRPGARHPVVHRTRNHPGSDAGGDTDGGRAVCGLQVGAGTVDQPHLTRFTLDEILLGNGVPGLLIGTVATSVTILAAVLWFDEALRDNPLALSFGVLLFVASVIGTGAAMSSIGAAQQHALLGGIPIRGALHGFFWVRDSDRQFADSRPHADLAESDSAHVDRRSVSSLNAPTSTFIPECGAMAVIAELGLFAADWLFRRRAQ